MLLSKMHLLVKMIKSPFKTKRDTGQEKESASEGCISDSGSVETGIQAPNSYFASSSSEELSDSDDE